MYPLDEFDEEDLDDFNEEEKTKKVVDEEQNDIESSDSSFIPEIPSNLTLPKFDNPELLKNKSKKIINKSSNQSLDDIKSGKIKLRKHKSNRKKKILKI